MITTLCLAVVLTTSGAPAPKDGPPRVLAVSSNKDGNWEIYLIQPDTGETKNITNHKAADTDPAWSPDGKKIAFVSDRSGSREIWLVNADGGQPKQLTTNVGAWTELQKLTTKAGTWTELRWSPDAKRIAFVGEKDATYNIFTADAETGKVAALTDEQSNCREPAWSPDGKKLAYSVFPKEGRWQVHLINADGTGKRDVTGETGGTGPAWSPDGKQLAFTSLRDDTGFRLYALDLNSGDVRDLFSYAAPVLVAVPQWSPDGKTIAFAEWNGDEQKMQVSTVGADGKMPKMLTKTSAHAHVRWSPDGKSLSYGRFEDEHGYFRDRQSAVLIVSDADGKNPRELIRGYRTAEWKPK